MQVFLPKPQLPAVIGPPAPPAPTIVQFDRNVVVLRGEVDDDPDQLTSDTLKLSLVPGDKQPRGPQTNADGTNAQPSTPASKPSDGESNGLFGGLTLQRAYATGHVVWLYMPKQGTKLRCNELIHMRQAPYRPDMTYFRGDDTRPVEIEKLDISYDEADDLDPGTITSVTYIWTKDATLFDNGTGMDTANVRAAALAGWKPVRVATNRSKRLPSGKTNSSSRTS